MTRTRTAYSPLTREATRLLGRSVRAARLERRWSVKALAERVGTSPPTIEKIERGDLTVGIGIAFETAAVLGIPLFTEDPTRRRLEERHIDDRLAVLPRRARPAAEVDD